MQLKYTIWTKNITKTLYKYLYRNLVLIAQEKELVLKE